VDGDIEGYVCGLHGGVAPEGGDDPCDRGPGQEGGEVSGCLGRGTTGSSCLVCPATTSPGHPANLSLRSHDAGNVFASQRKEDDPFLDHSPGEGKVAGANGPEFVLAAGGRSDSIAAPVPVGPLQVVVGSPPVIGAGDFGTAWLVTLPKPPFHRLGGL
jgi:hypothetical protein